MTPIVRKANSESLLRNLAIPINKHLPVVESEAEVDLRSDRELLQRLIALWAVVGAAVLPGEEFFRNYINSQQVAPWLSEKERSFLVVAKPDERERIKFSWRLEALYFLSWCGGLVEEISIPSQKSSVEDILHLFPHGDEQPERLSKAIHMRPKAEVLDWADLLYRLHWAVRDAQLHQRPLTPVIGGAVQEWHHAVNWMVKYDAQDNWDEVATDT